ncbi:MAG: DUF2269 family protein [Anaerolineales bacterium]
MYPILRFLHVFSALCFFLIHGATAAAMFALKRERDAKRVEGLLTIRDFATKWMWLPLGILLISGTVMGFMGRWWNQTWIWLAIGVFLAISFPMSGLGRPYHDRLWHAIDPQGHAPQTKKEKRLSQPASADELVALLAVGRPMLLTVIGVAGLGIILWLMMFKPF